jgi:general secretion pathway protein B
MSFILDALKRAESERQRGQVPGLQAQPLVAGGSRAADPGSRLGWWLGGTALVLAALVAAVLWLRGSGTPPPPAPGPVAAATAPSAVPPTTPSAAPATTPATASSTEPATPAAPPPALSGPVVRAGTAPATTTTAGVTAATAATAATAGATKDAPKGAPGVASQGAGSPSVPGTASSTVAAAVAPAPGARPPTPSATAAPDPVTAVRLSDLPAELRAQLPALAVQAAMYSDQPSQRLLVVNGQALGQGAAIGPDLVIESIGLNSSVLVFRGQTRFRLPH